MISTANDGNNKIWINDNVFNNNEIRDFLDLYCINKKPFPFTWYSKQYYNEKFRRLNDFFKECNLNFNFEGIELWTQYNSKTDRHQDKDEYKLFKYNELHFPIFSTVIFLNVENDHEGFLMFDSGISIRPKVNRVVLFTPGTFHEVSNFLSNRVTLLINFWSYRIKGAV